MAQVDGDDANGEGKEGAASHFTLTLPAGLPAPILITVPHAGRDYPTELIASMREPSWGPARLEDRFADHIGSAVAKVTGVALLVSSAPRAMIDLNRAPDDVDWSMVTGAARRAPHSALNRRARSGLGLVPRRLAGLGEIWKQRLPIGELERRIGEVHRPYHISVEHVLEKLRDRWGAALLIDLHSMPPLGPSRHSRAATIEEGAEFVIGDRFGASCAPELSAHAINALASAGRRVAHNRPYSGGYSLDRHAAPRRGIHAMQIEVCRSIYLDARLDQPGPRLPAVARTLANLVRSLAHEVAMLSNASGYRQAAE